MIDLKNDSFDFETLPRESIYRAFAEGLDSYNLGIEAPDVELVIDGFLEGLEWLSKKTGISISSFNLGVIDKIGHGGASTLITSDGCSVLFTPSLFKMAAEARMAAQQEGFTLEDIQFDATILPGLPVITLSVRDLYITNGIAEGVHLIQRMVGLGEISSTDFFPMTDKEVLASSGVNMLEGMPTFDPDKYQKDPFEIQEKTWVNRYFEEKYGKDNPYKDFYGAFIKPKPPAI